MKTIMRYYYKPTKMPKTKKIVTTPNVSEDAKKMDHIYIKYIWSKYKIVWPLWKIVWEFL